ncbi:MAG: HAD family hydrolase, partial [Woeseiaceae bacterium]
MSGAPNFEAVLFDLDGTLIDTALDMVGVLLEQLLDEGHEPIDFEVARSNVSHGSAGLINLAFPDVSNAEHERLRTEYLNRYEAAVCVDSVVFPGLDQLLDAFQ